MAKDQFHEEVKTALLKEGWLVTHDPYHFVILEARFKIDLGLIQLLAAEKDREKIAVEVKSFLSKSLTYEFHTALGQFIEYRTALALFEPERVLYLAVPKDFYYGFFQRPFYQHLAKQERLKFAIYNIQTETIESWIE